MDRRSDWLLGCATNTSSGNTKLRVLLYHTTRLDSGFGQDEIFLVLSCTK